MASSAQRLHLNSPCSLSQPWGLGKATKKQGLVRLAGCRIRQWLRLSWLLDKAGLQPKFQQALHADPVLTLDVASEDGSTSPSGGTGMEESQCPSPSGPDSDTTPWHSAFIAPPFIEDCLTIYIPHNRTEYPQCLIAQTSGSCRCC